jgi:hypothetical protein
MQQVTPLIVDTQPGRDIVVRIAGEAVLVLAWEGWREEDRPARPTRRVPVWAGAGVLARDEERHGWLRMAHLRHVPGIEARDARDVDQVVAGVRAGVPGSTPQNGSQGCR